MRQAMKWMVTSVVLAAAVLSGCGDNSGSAPSGGRVAAPAAPKAASDAGKRAADATKSGVEATAASADKETSAAAKEAGAAAADAAGKAPAMAQGHGSAKADLTVGTLGADDPKPANTVCPVGGEPVSPTDPKAPVAIHDGKAYAMCCADCVAPFLKDPAKHLAKANSK